MADLIVKAAVKEATEKNVGGEFYEALDEKVEALLADAERRADENGRATVQQRDLWPGSRPASDSAAPCR